MKAKFELSGDSLRILCPTYGCYEGLVKIKLAFLRSRADQPGPPIRRACRCTSATQLAKRIRKDNVPS